MQIYWDMLYTTRQLYQIIKTVYTHQSKIKSCQYLDDAHSTLVHKLALILENANMAMGRLLDCHFCIFEVLSCWLEVVVFSIRSRQSCCTCWKTCINAFMNAVLVVVNGWITCCSGFIVTVFDAAVWFMRTAAQCKPRAVGTSSH